MTNMNKDLHDSESEVGPVTSYPCQWKVPKKRKGSNIPFSEAVFKKHDYNKQNKRKVDFTENFDPRPAEYKGTAPTLLPILLNEICGEGLVLFDSSTCQKTISFTDTAIPDLTALMWKPSKKA